MPPGSGMRIDTVFPEINFTLRDGTEGDIDFSAVFLLQGELVDDQDELAQAQGDIITNLIQLYKALGGGWEIRCLPAGEMEVVSSSKPDGVRVVASDNKRQLAENRSNDDFPESISAMETIRRAVSRNEPRRLVK